jgi:hypothetical protein
MLNLGSYLRFPPIGFLVGIGQWGVAARSFVSEVFCFWRNLLEHFLLPNVGAVTIQLSLVAMQQIRQLLTVMHVNGSDARAVCEAGFAVHANMYFHAEVPLIPALCRNANTTSLLLRKNEIYKLEAGGYTGNRHSRRAKPAEFAYKFNIFPR